MFFSPKAAGKMILVLEIQSAIVRSSLVWYRPGLPVNVVFLVERAIPYKANVGTPYFIKTTLKALSQVIDEALRDLHVISHSGKHDAVPGSVDEVHYILSSPWIASQARTLTMSFDKSTPITHEKVSEIISAERQKLVPEAQGPLETVEEKIFDVRLNGYRVNSWEGKSAESLEISYAVTVGGADSMRHFREACEAAVRESKVYFHSSLLLQYVGILTAMPKRMTYTLIHIHGELTDILAVKNGSCTFFGSYPMGIGTIIRKIANATKTDIQTADSLLSLYLGNKLDEEHAKEIAPIMDSMSSGWSGELHKLLKDSSISGSLERDMIVAARAHEDFFVKSLKSSKPDAHIEAWSANDIMQNVDFESSAHRLRVVSAYAIALKELSEGRL